MRFSSVAISIHPDGEISPSAAASPAETTISSRRAARREPFHDGREAAAAFDETEQIEFDPLARLERHEGTAAYAHRL